MYLKMLIYIYIYISQTFKQNIFLVQAVTKNGVYLGFECDNCQLIYPNGTVFNIREDICIIWKISFLPEMPLMTYILGIKS